MGDGLKNEANTIKDACGHTAPIRHEYRLKQLDDNLITALKEVTGKTYRLEDLKTPAELGTLTALEENTFRIKDMGYEDVCFQDLVNPSVLASAELVDIYGEKYWEASFRKAIDLKNVGVILKKDSKLSYINSDKTVVRISLGEFFDYTPESETFWLHAGYQFNSYGEYDANGNMLYYGYNGEQFGAGASAKYDLNNKLVYAVFTDAKDRWWFFNEDEDWVYTTDEIDDFISAQPDEVALASVLPPLRQMSNEKDGMLLTPTVAEKERKEITLNKNVLNLVEGYKSDLIVEYDDARMTIENSLLDKVGAFKADSVIMPDMQTKTYEQISLTAEQENTAKTLQVGGYLSPELRVDGKEIESFGGESFIAEIDFTPAAGTAGSDWVVAHLREDGGLEVQPTEYRSGKLYVTFSHFSDYAIVRSAPQASLPQTGDNSRLLLWLGALALSVFAADRMRRRADA